MREPAHRTEPVGKWISIIYRCGRAFFDRQLAGDDISGGHLPFIFTLYRRGGLSQHELSESIGFDKTTTARVVKSLISLGYVSRTRDPEDGRVYRLFLTSEAKALLPRIEECLAKWAEVLLAGFSPGERQELEKFLRRMSENAVASKGL